VHGDPTFGPLLRNHGFEHGLGPPFHSLLLAVPLRQAAAQRSAQPLPALRL
jgi:hypothetical protein